MPRVQGSGTGQAGGKAALNYAFGSEAGKEHVLDEIDTAWEAVSPEAAETFHAIKPERDDKIAAQTTT